MPGKMPSFRLVVGKETVGTLWNSTSKKGTNYHSGQLDITALKKAMNTEKTKKAMVRVNRAGDKAEHDVLRVAMFTVEAVKQPDGVTL